MAAIETPKLISAALRNAGAVLPLASGEGGNFIRGLVAQIPDQAGLLAGRSGWHGNDFLLGSRPIGRNYSGPLSCFNDQAPTNMRLNSRVASTAPTLSQRGTLGTWFKNIAEPATASTAISFAIMVAFAAPLARFASLDEGAVFNFSGKTSTGKTTGLRAALSIYSAPRKLTDWNVSPRALEESAAAFSDLPFVIDDLERLRNDGRRVSEFLSKQLHVITAGRSARNSDVVREGLSPLEWSAMALSTSPRTLREQFARDHKEPTAGDEARWIDIAVDPIKGGVWDRSPPMSSPVSLALRSEAIKEATEHHHGVVGKRWLSKLVRQHNVLPAVVTQLIEEFVSVSLPEGSAEERRIARKIGAVYAGGMLAVKTGNLPWSKDHPMVVCCRVLDNYLNSRRSESASMEAIRAALVGRVRDSSVIPTYQMGVVPEFVDNAHFVGFRRANDRNVFLRNEFIQQIAGSLAQRLLIDLQMAGATKAGQGGKATAQVRVRVGGGSIKARLLVFDFDLFVSTLSPKGDQKV